MKVLILSKTKYGPTQYCIGGITIDSHKFVRLLGLDGRYQPINTTFEIGDVWDIDFIEAPNRKEPHNEDVLVRKKVFVEKIYKLSTYIRKMGVHIWQGDITNTYDGNLLWTRNGKGYISENQKLMPTNSVGFWIPDKDLALVCDDYVIGDKKVKYKGAENPKSIISAGALVRVSLAKWWHPDDFNEERCYLQLSGWYLDKPNPKTAPNHKDNITGENKLVSRQLIDDFQKIEKLSIPNYKLKDLKNKDGACYIATLCYKDPYAEEVCTFRDYRDNTLSKYSFGLLLIRIYYRYSPLIVMRLKNNRRISDIIRIIILSPLLCLIKARKWDK